MNELLSANLTILALYFLPTILALARSRYGAGAVFVVNLVFGWTILGWIVALIWSLSGPAGSIRTRINGTVRVETPRQGQ